MRSEDERLASIHGALADQSKPNSPQEYNTLEAAFWGASPYSRGVGVDLHRYGADPCGRWHNCRAGAKVELLRGWTLAASEGCRMFRIQKCETG